MAIPSYILNLHFTNHSYKIKFQCHQNPSFPSLSLLRPWHLIEEEEREDMENFSPVQATSVRTRKAQKIVTKNDKKNTCNGKDDHVWHVSSNYLPLPLPPQRLHLPRGNATMEVTRPEKKPRSKVSSRSKSWFETRDMERRKRVMMYKLYAAEGKIKRSFKKGIKWVKHQCNKIAEEFS